MFNLRGGGAGAIPMTVFFRNHSGVVRDREPKSSLPDLRFKLVLLAPDSFLGKDKSLAYDVVSAC